MQQVVLLVLLVVGFTTEANPLPGANGTDEVVSMSDASDVLPSSMGLVSADASEGGVWLPFVPAEAVPEESVQVVPVTVIPTELEDGEMVTVHEPTGLDDRPPPPVNEDDDGGEEEEEEDAHTATHVEEDEEGAASEQMMGAEAEEQEHGLVKESFSPQQEQQEEAEVNVSEWMPPTTTASAANDQEAENDLIARANAVSAPWTDAMVVGLPPSVAYDWQFLFNLASKIKSASYNVKKGGAEGGYNARLKYLLTRIRDEATRSKLQFQDAKKDTLKHQHQLKAKLDAAGYHDDALRWAWRRAV